MKFVSWNVAGFRACYKKGFEQAFYELNADIFALQEVKATAEELPFHPEKYICYQNCAEKKGYSGTLIYTKRKPLSVSYGMNKDLHDHEGRLITLEYPDFYFVNVYVPNVKRDLSRLDYRMIWEDDFLVYLKTLENKKPVIVCGDFNVAHQEIDIKNAKQNRGNAGFTDEEREKFTHLLANGFIDTFRYFYPNKSDAYSWWSYMANARLRNIGWRIDYFLVSQSLQDRIIDARIHSSVSGSDHCPIELTLKENIS